MKSRQQEVPDDGFSSDEEMQKEEIYVHEKRTTQAMPITKEQVKCSLPPAPEIREKRYPLYPDITSGWMPRILLPNPIPILYENRIVDHLIRELLKKNSNPQYKVVYLGPRYENTFFVHYGREHDYPFPYTHIKPPEKIKYTNRLFLGNNPQHTDQIQFDSHFESGNLDCVIKLSPHDYDLFILVDTNTKGHLQWYNFKVKGATRGQSYRFNICNFQKSKSLYSRGMKPFVHSKRKTNRFGTGWEQAGDNLKYELKQLRYGDVIDCEFQKYCRMSFEYTFEYDDDEVQFAYCVPYTYSHLLKFINQLTNKYGDSGYLKVSALEVPLLTIHQPEPQEQSLQNASSPTMEETKEQPRWPYASSKKCIVISGRAHPGQSNGSHMMHGFLEFLCGNSQAATYLRKHIEFKIVPMLNPDGVVVGNYRTGLSGRDFNRQFLNPDRFVFPQISALKDLVIKCKSQYKQNMSMFLDFHGHSIKKNVFMYGPQFPITHRYYYESKILPKMLGNETPMFRYYSCIFRVSSFKETTARAVLLKKLDVPFCYTIEASNGSYYHKDEMKDILFTPMTWTEMGHHIGKTLYKYMSALNSAEQLRLQKQRQRQNLLTHKKKRSFVESRRMSKYSAPTPTRVKKPVSDMRKEVVDDVQPGILQQIVQEIKIAQKQEVKEKDRMSDDQMSEGSSDQQKQADDLSPEKYKKLCKIITCRKFKGLENCKMSIREPNETPSPIRSRPIRQFSTKTNKNDDEQIFGLIASNPCQSSVNLRQKSQSDLNEDERFPQSQTPAIIEVFTNRAKMTVRSKFSSAARQSQTVRETSKTRQAAKINNISFIDPFWHDIQKSQKAEQKSESNMAVDSLRRTFHMYRDMASHYVKFLNLSGANKSLHRHHEIKSKLRQERRSLNGPSTASYH